MLRQMQLQSDMFEKIKAGIKRVEIRLCDEKRQRVAVGDTIVFTNANNLEQKLEVKITALKKFQTFRDLFMTYDPELYGFDNSSDYESVYQYYSKEDEKRYGVLAIHLAI